MDRRLGMTLAAVVVACLTSACTASTGPASTTRPAVAAEVRLGSFLPLTGPYSHIGIPSRHAQELAVEQINDAGGVLGRRLVLQSLDGGCDPALTVAAVQQLIEDEADVTVGGICSASLTNALPLLRQAKMPHVEPAANSTDLLRDPYPGLFLMGETVADEAEAASAWLSDLRIRRPVIVHDGTSFALTLALSSEAAFRAVERPAVLTVEIPQGARTYARTVEQILRTGADSVFFAGYYAEAGVLIKDLRAAGFDGVVLAGDGAADLAVIETAGTDDLAGVYFVTPAQPQTTASAAGWTEQYRTFAGVDPGAFSMQSYAAVRTAAEAIERAGTTEPEAVVRALRETRVSTPYGEVRFDDRQVASTGFQLVTIMDGVMAQECFTSCAGSAVVPG